MTITWLGHACFCLEQDGFRILLDPYGRVEGYPEPRAAVHAVFCSHGHQDHANRAATTLLPAREDPFTVVDIPSFHDDQRGALRGENTIRLFQMPALRVAHLGDLGHLPDAALCAALADLDVLLLPVGGFYTVDAAQAHEIVSRLRPRIAVPMHYRHAPYGLPNVGGVEDFLSRFDAARIIRLAENRFDPADFAPGSIVVPHYCGSQME